MIMRMSNPPHPGEVLRELWLKPEHITVSRAAQALGISRKHLSGIVNGRANITPELALRLEMALGVSAESWLGHQMAYDLWQAEQHRHEFTVTSLRAA
jgi:addiction module HigA family antidote